MVQQKYSGEDEIRKKINELFDYRKLTDLLVQTQLHDNVDFVNRLTELQYRIYLLDAYLESQWSLDATALQSHWNGIYDALATFDVDAKEIRKLLKEIRIYEHIEINCRKQKWPTRVAFKTFYTTKSCDVRLIRKLIYRVHPELDETMRQSAWAWYDLITEVNDDIADLQEDLRTYNGNRFLISVIRKGFNKTAKRYRQQIESITKRATIYFKKHKDVGAHQTLYEWTLLRSAETLALLDNTQKQSDHSIFTQSLMLEKMK